MLKKMRRRVILAAMLAFAAVIVLIGVLVNVFNYAAVTRRADETISYILQFETGTPDVPPENDRIPEDQLPGDGGPGGERPEDRPSGEFRALPDLEENYMTRFFVVRVDGDGNVAATSRDYIATVSEEDAVYYAEKALKRGSESGYIGEYRYLQSEDDSGSVLIFLNVSRELQSVKSLRTMTVVISLGSLLLVFLLVVPLSEKAIRPIANNIQRQKQFITDASHELKTPLTSISTSADVISMEYGDDEWTDNIKKQTGRMSKLVSELVALSRLDEEDPLPDKEEFSVTNTAWELVEAFGPQAKGRGKKLTAEIPEDISLYGDKAAVRQMLSVLLDNALRYSDPEGEIRLSVTKKGSKTQIVVFNTCDLEEPPDVDRLFDRFYRPDSSRSTETGGAGVGLAIARAAAEAHGGSISASCPDGKSMTMTVIL